MDLNGDQEAMELQREAFYKRILSAMCGIFYGAETVQNAIAKHNMCTYIATNIAFLASLNCVSH